MPDRLVNARPRPLPPAGVLDRLPEPVVQQALWWEHHILEVLHGLPPDTPPGAVARPDYDPRRRSLTSREQAKAAELTAAGHQVTASTVKHHRQRYEAQGVAGLVDYRADKRTSPFGRVDARVVAAMRTAISEATDASSRTASYVLWRTRQLVVGIEAEDTEPVVVPSRRTLYRLFAKLAEGRHVTGSARTRRSLANRPDGPFGELPALAPGELMQIDSTPLDVLVRLDDGVAGKVELTGMIDVATCTVIAAVLRPTTKSVDASVLLARTVTPEPMRPGWVEALRMSRSVLPYRRLLGLDARLEQAAARPVMVPSTIVCDHGKVFISRNFQASCRFLGINFQFQPTHPGTPTDKPHIEPTDKPHIEKMLASVATLFAQFVAGYTGSSPSGAAASLRMGRCGRCWNCRTCWTSGSSRPGKTAPTTGCVTRPPLGGRSRPNERYAMLVEAAGYVPVALSADDYIELLPARWHAINAYGVKLNHRTYDAEALNPLRQQRSGIRERNDRWEVHHDPYDVSRIWARDRDGGWITAFWKHLHRVPMPFGELAWNHARQGLPQGTEAEIAETVAIAGWGLRSSRMGVSTPQCLAQRWRVAVAERHELGRHFRQGFEPRKPTSCRVSRCA